MLHLPTSLRLLTLASFVWVSPLLAARPNIVLILSDDMGFSDIGCYGSEIHTPNLDRLATQGVRLAQFYNAGRCCPTRASLLTGLYPHQAGIGHMMEDRGFAGYRGDLSDRCVTLAEVLKAAGYHTYAVGKWHVTRHAKPEGPKTNWPLHRGFERFYGTITGAGSFYDPGTLTRDDTMISPFADPEYRPENYYYTDALTDHAVRDINEHALAHKDSPFFLYLAYTAAHWPLHALKEDVAKYRGRYDAGYDAVRKARIQRMKKLGILAADAPVSPTVGDWSLVDDKAWEARCMEVYAAMVDRMDQGIGRVMAALERMRLLENTLIIFLQDNGGCQEPIGRRRSTSDTTAKSYPRIAQEAIRLDVIPKQMRDGRAVQQGYGIPPGEPESYIAYGEAWANVSNTPHREYKHFVHEGGISTPLIAHWPAGIPAAQHGKILPSYGHLIDIMATCVDAAQAGYPAQYRGRPIQPMEGTSLLPAFQGKVIAPHPIFWEHEGNRAVRMGPWKIVAKADQPWELYHLEKDRAEQHDLSSTDPARVREMAALWDAWAARSQVLPLGAWKAPVVKKNGKKQRRNQRQD